MEIFEKYENLLFELRKKDNSNQKEEIKKFSYIYDYDEIDPLILEIISNGKKQSESEWVLKNKKIVYKLKLISKRKVSPKEKGILEKNQFLLDNLKQIQSELETKENEIKKLNEEIENLKQKAILDANIFKNEVMSIQKKAQEAINEYKQKATDHQDIQIKEAKMYALQSFLEKLILPLNNFEIAINAAKKIDNSVLNNFIVGFSMLYKQVEDVLINAGLTKIIPNIGDMFDANIHQVYELVTSDLEKDTIIEIKNIGYKLHDRVIKPALVIVAK
ncbi:Heat shock GrpE protein (HSP-70 cofactor) [Metamycoplasma auris 15026]|uniref:Protein GrpE n=1 Tax=Metamycoplasma auris 15026 TaxID=1188233 RepID=N9V1V1_9BACT|nr:nucleotide exchange factor GrpE [Metamycoplasma auris]ENY69357.1 Heat shock GrpE protein (HSP-70 cofactor) [Metamycoplasma auris 15026]